jgi:hypothetical protein
MHLVMGSDDQIRRRIAENSTIAGFDVLDDTSALDLIANCVSNGVQN